MFGLVNEDGEMTGERVAYIYPDGLTALLGSFVDGELIQARCATMISKRNEKPHFKITPNSKCIVPFSFRHVCCFTNDSFALLKTRYIGMLQDFIC